MAEGIVQETCLDGVTIRVTKWGGSFNVTVIIPKGTNLWKKRENECGWVKFKTHQQHKFARKKIELNATYQRYEEKQLLKHYRREFVIEEGDKCCISLFPEFYLREDLARKAKRERENRKRSANFGPGICTRVGGSSSRRRGKPTVYSRNNAFHPYQGGDCTTK